MKRMVLVAGLLALGFAASTPARADFAVIKFQDGTCRPWADSKVGPWPPGSVYLAVGLPSWDAATKMGQQEVSRHRCQSLRPF